MRYGLGKCYVSGQQPVNTLYISTGGTGVAGGISFKDEDIVAYDMSSGNWSIHIDGSDIGLGTPAKKLMHSMSMTTAASCSAWGYPARYPMWVRLMISTLYASSPLSTGETTAGSYEMYFDGEDVGLTGEDIDAMGFAPDGRLVVSLRGSFNIGGFRGGDEDMLIFTDTSLGATTSGTWELYFDGSIVGLNDNSGEDINGTWIDSNGDIYLSTRSAFAVTGASGDGADIFTCVPSSFGAITSCTFSPYWDGSAYGLAGVINGFFLGP